MKPKKAKPVHGTTKVVYGCAIQRHDGSFTIIGPFEDSRDQILETCELLEPTNPGRRIYHVARIEIEL